MSTMNQPKSSVAETPPLTADRTMKAVAVIAGKANSIHQREVARPRLDAVPGGRGVMVKVIRVGVDGTDKEINAAEYGAAPPGGDYLITGHESFGVVVNVGANVTEFRPGDYVVATVRRPGASPYDAIGLQDMTTDDVYFERGINLLHGYLAEYYVDQPEFLVRIPERLRDVAVLLEPSSVAEKAISQAFDIQRRLRIWRPRRAAVLGAGTLGLLTSLFLKLRGFEVTTLARSQPPTMNSDLLEAIGVRYVSLKDTSLTKASALHGPFDFIFEGTGFAPLVFEAMDVLAKNGVLAMVSVTGGDKRIELPVDHINQGFVLGNKLAFGSVNAHRDDFMRGVQDLSQAELMYPGWLARLITHRVQGLENYAEMMQLLTTGKDTIKVCVEVSPDPQVS